MLACFVPEPLLTQAYEAAVRESQVCLRMCGGVEACVWLRRLCVVSSC